MTIRKKVIMATDSSFKFLSENHATGALGWEVTPHVSESVAVFFHASMYIYILLS
jgi:hypothetical protein